MWLQCSGAKKAALTLLLADVVFGEPLTTIHPCKEAASAAWPPITVTSQYQPVSTCHATTACIKGKCSTIYPFTTYPFVSTVVPCAWNGTTTQRSTVTDVTQPFRVSEHLETLTTITAATPNERYRADWLVRNKPGTSLITLYETVTRRAVAPFNECGPLAIPGWEGSGLCENCENPQEGSRAQLLDVVECRSGVDAAGKSYEKCAQWYETWIPRPDPTSTVTASARCSSQGKIPGAGTYTWTFSQTAPPVTITAPPRTVTVTISGRKNVAIHPKSVYTIAGRHWNACVTKSFSEATTFNFNVFVTKTIVFNIPNYVLPAKTTRHISVPRGSRCKHRGGGWPLSNKNGPDSYYGKDGDKGWANWAPSTKTTTATRTDLESSTNASSPSIGYIFSQAPISRTASPFTSITSTSSTSSSVGTSTPSRSNFSLSLGPIQRSVTASPPSSFSFSLGPIVQSTSTSSFPFSLGPIIQSIITSTSSSSSSTTTTSSDAIGSPTEGATTSTSASSTTPSSTTPSSTAPSSTAPSSTAPSSTAPSSTTSSSTSSSTSLTSSTRSTTANSSSTTTPTPTAAPVCNLLLSICPNAGPLVAATITSVQCPLGIGLICTANQLRSLIPQLLQSNPNVLSVIVGNNQVLGLNITPQQVQVLALNGVLTSTCPVAQQINVVISDPTCP